MAVIQTSLLKKFFSPMAMAFSLAQTTTIRSTITLSLPFSTSTSPAASSFLSNAKLRQPNKWRSQVASSLELGGVKIAKEDVVRDDDPTNNIPDSIFEKLGMQLHRRDNHPLGILKNTIYDYFNTNYSNKFDKFDDLCPIVSVKQNFDDVLVPADHVSRSYNDTYYVDSQTVLRCHTSAHQAELLREDGGISCFFS